MFYSTLVVIDIDKASNTTSSRNNSLQRIIREMIAILFHLYAFFQVWVFDVDTFIRNVLPDYLQWLPSFKIFIFSGIFIIYWAILGNKNFLFSLLYIIFYPFIIVSWYIPLLLLRKINYTLYLLPIIPALRQIKVKIFTAFFVIVSLTVILLSNNALLLSTSIYILVAYLLFHYSRKVYFAFFPKTLFDHLSEVIRKYLPKFNKYFVDNTSKFHTNNDVLIKKPLHELFTLYCLNRGLALSVNTVSNFKSKRLGMLYALLSLANTFLITVTIFAFIYYALNKINATYFDNQAHHAWQFLLLSVNTLLNIDIYQVLPINGVIPGIIITFESLLIFFFVVVLPVLVFSVFLDRNSDALENIIVELERQSTHIEKAIEQKYKIGILQAEYVMIQLYPGVITIFKKLDVVMIEDAENCCIELPDDIKSIMDNSTENVDQQQDNPE